MNKGKISIIVPVYNAEKYLRQCLDSLIYQKYKNIEIILVPQKSKDKSFEICNEYALKDSRVKIFYQEEPNRSCARNNGINVSTGEYIMFVDSDDWISLSNCAVAYKVAKKHSADVVFWSYISEIENKSRNKNIFDEPVLVFQKEETRSRLHRRFVGLLNEELKNPEKADILSTVWGKIYRAEIIKEKNVKFIDTDLIGPTEDILFNLHFFGSVEKSVYIKKYFYHYRQDNYTSITKRHNSKLYVQFNNFFDLMENYICENKLSKNYKQALNNRIVFSIIGMGRNELNSNHRVHIKVMRIKNILYSERYKKAIVDMNFKYLSMPWKVFFKLAKERCAFGVYLLLSMMSLIIIFKRKV